MPLVNREKEEKQSTTPTYILSFKGKVLKNESYTVIIY